MGTRHLAIGSSLCGSSPFSSRILVWWSQSWHLPRVVARLHLGRGYLGPRYAVLVDLISVYFPRFVLTGAVVSPWQIGVKLTWWRRVPCVGRHTHLVYPACRHFAAVIVQILLWPLLFVVTGTMMRRRRAPFFERRDRLAFPHCRRFAPLIE